MDSGLELLRKSLDFVPIEVHTFISIAYNARGHIEPSDLPQERL